MDSKIRAHLKTHLECLSQLNICLKEEQVVLKKGNSQEVMALVYKKQQLIRQLDELEEVRVQLLKSETLTGLETKFPNDPELKSFLQAYRDICASIQQLNRQNQELTQIARGVMEERMAFYTSMVQQPRTPGNTYTRGGQYDQTQQIGSTVMNKTI